MLQYTKHEKLSLRKCQFNEAWLHDRICEDPAILGLGDVRVIDRERASPGGGRLDLLLFDEDNNRRYEVEVMLGATDPSHIIRTLEYWDLERRRYPSYEHIAVLIAEDVTARFLNVMNLLAGSIPLIAIQLDALRIGEQVVLNFVQVLDQTDLRVDDTEDTGGQQVDRGAWEQKVGPDLMHICDEVLAMINEAAKVRQELNYRQNYIGLKSNGVVANFVRISPKPTKKIAHILVQNSNMQEWKDRFEEASVPARLVQRRLRVTVTPAEWQEQSELLRELIEDAVRHAEG